MPRTRPTKSAQAAQTALRCLQRVSQHAPADVPAAAVYALDTAAGDLVKPSLKDCAAGRLSDAGKVVAGAYENPS
jgi:hypothetical protein